MKHSNFLKFCQNHWAVMSMFISMSMSKSVPVSMSVSAFVFMLMCDFALVLSRMTFRTWTWKLLYAWTQTLIRTQKQARTWTWTWTTLTNLLKKPRELKKFRIHKSKRNIIFWRPYSLHSRTGPVGQPFASHLDGQRIAP